MLDVGFDKPIHYAPEGTTVNIAYERNSWGTYNGEFRVKYHTNALTATENVDYTGVTAGELVFAAGVNSQNISIPIAEDSATDPWEAFTIEIDEVYCVDSPRCVDINKDTSSHTVFIVDMPPETPTPTSTNTPPNNTITLNPTERTTTPDEGCPNPWKG